MSHKFQILLNTNKYFLPIGYSAYLVPLPNDVASLSSYIIFKTFSIVNFINT